MFDRIMQPASNQGQLHLIEFPARDMLRVHDFYHAVFAEWEFIPMDRPISKGPTCIMIRFSDKYNTDIAGCITSQPPGRTPGPHVLAAGSTNYFLVESIDEFITRAVSLGARLVLPKMAMMNWGWRASLLDIEGNRFGIMERPSTQGNPMEETGEPIKAGDSPMAGRS